MTENNGHSTADDIDAAAKAAFKKLGKSTCIVSCFSNGQPHASISTAVCNVSNSPPSLLMCLEKTSSMASLLGENASFAVNVTGADQQDIVEHCMNSTPKERFAVGNWASTDEQLPLLIGSQASFCCRVAEVHGFESHYIVIGRIEDSRCAEHTSGLIYLGGKFHGIE